MVRFSSCRIVEYSITRLGDRMMMIMNEDEKYRGELRMNYEKK